MWTIQSMSLDMNNPRNDGFSTWPIKQDLYKIKWAVDSILDRAPTYAGEKEWLAEQNVDKALRELGYNNE